MNRQRIRISLVFTCLFSLAVAIQPIWAQDSAHADAKTADELEIYLTVVRSQMEQWIRNADKEEAEAKEEWQKATAKRMNFRVFFVSVKGRDPSDSLIRRLHDIPRKIAKLSRARYGKLGAPFDKTTNQAGIVFNVKDIRWFSNDAVAVTGGYYCGGRCGAWITFTVQREGVKWVVKSSEVGGML